MSELAFFTHVPALRIDKEQVPFARGLLWQMPFSDYDELSLGAFSDHQEAYEKTQPVFYCLETETSVPCMRPASDQPVASLDLKLGVSGDALLNGIGLDIVPLFFRNYVAQAWLALTLALPAAAMPRANSSVTFVLAQGGEVFVPPMNDEEREFQVVHLQGEIDQEYLFNPQFSATACTEADLAYAESLIDRLGNIVANPDLAQALRMLTGCESPSLSIVDRALLSSIAMEALVLPGIQSGIARTFSERVSNLLGANDGERDSIRRYLKKLYDLRSDRLHGREQTMDKADDIALAPHLLARTIIEMSEYIDAGEEIDGLRERLSEETFPFREAKDDGKETPPSAVSLNDRLQYDRGKTVATSGTVNMGTPEGVEVAWWPIIGLTPDASNDEIAAANCGYLSALYGREIHSLEDKDIARDFVSKLTMIEEPLGTMLSTSRPLQDGESPANPSEEHHVMIRDLIVIALRCSGFNTFHDPELLGSFVYRKSFRFRRPTVFRQTIYNECRMPTLRRDRLSLEHCRNVDETLQGLLGYLGQGSDHRVDRVLRSYRKSFDWRFTSPLIQQSLQFACLEAMLGGFGRYGSDDALENVVTRAVGENVACVPWFEESGRKVRNEIAHGTLQDDHESETSLAMMAELLANLVPRFVDRWVQTAGQDTEATPRSAFLSQFVENNI